MLAVLPFNLALVNLTATVCEDEEFVPRGMPRQ